MKSARKPGGNRLQTPSQLPYDELMQFNQHCMAALGLVEGFARARMIPRTEAGYYRSMLQEFRACISQTVLEHMDQHELTNAAEASKERVKLEKRLLK